MAEITFNYAFAAGLQTDLGTPNDTIRDLTDASSVSGTDVSSADGIILGDPDSGIGESGISHTAVREYADKSRLTGFTEQPSDFLRESVSNLAVSWTAKGNGLAATDPIQDSEFTPVPGIDAVMRSAGLEGLADPVLTGWLYRPSLTQEYVTVKVWVGDEAWVYQDCICSSLVLANTPGEASVFTANLVGNFYAYQDSGGGGAFPTLNFGQVAGVGGQDHSPPTLENAGNYWGVGDEERGFTDSTLTISNEVEDVPDSNAPGGVRQRQTDRLITYEQTLYATDTNQSYEHSELVRTTPPVDQILYTWGPYTSSPTADGDQINSLSVSLPTPELREMTPEKSGASLSRSLSMAAVSTSAQQQLLVRFL